MFYRLVNQFEKMVEGENGVIKFEDSNPKQVKAKNRLFSCFGSKNNDQTEDDNQVDTLKS